MSRLSNFAENKIIDHLTGVAAWTMPAGTWIQNHIGDPGEDCTANVAATSTRSPATWAAPASLAIANATAPTYTAAAAETISYWSAWDALAAGNPLFYGALINPTTLAVQIGDPFSIPVGDLDLSFAGTAFTTYGAHAVLNHLTGRAAMTAIAQLFARLHTGAPGVDAAANLAANSTRPGLTFAAAAGGAAAITAAAQWLSLTADETATAVSLHDASSGGNPVLQGNLAASKVLVTGQDAQFDAGALTVTLL